MEKIGKTKNPNLINHEGKDIDTIEREKREKIFNEIKEKRAERDDLLKESNSFKTKVKDFFGNKDEQYLKRKANDIQKKLYEDISIKHIEAENELNKEARLIFDKTIREPLLSIRNLYIERKKMNMMFEYPKKKLELELQLKEEISSFLPENIIEAFNDKNFLGYIVFDIGNFLKTDFTSDNIKQNEPDSYVGASGFPVDVSKSVIEGLNNVIKKEGVNNISEDAFWFPELLEIVNKAVFICPDAVDNEVKNNIAELVIKKGLEIKISDFSKLNNLIDLVQGSPFAEEFNSNLEEKIDQVFKEKKWSSIVVSSLVHSTSDRLRKITLEKTENYLHTFGINLSDVEDAWEISKPSNKSNFRNIENSFEMIELIEKERPGITKQLLKEFGIKEFYRYPSQILIDQFDKKDKNVPYGVIAYTNYDHNQAFDVNFGTLRSIYEQTKIGGLNIRIVEFDSKYGLMKRLASLDNKYGNEEKISYLILGAHGMGTSFIAGIGQIVENDNLEGKGVQRMKDFFIKNPEIILNSCSTGVEGGIGQKISKTYEAKVYAPSEPTAVAAVNVSFDKDHKPKFDVKYPSNVLKIYNNGEIF